MKKTIWLLALLSFFYTSIACYNEHHVTKNGISGMRSDPGTNFFNEPDKDAARTFLAKYDLSNVDQYYSDVQSDIAINLAYLGRYQESLQILRRLQRIHPSDYSIAANLGTTYELVGKNDSALIFIKKGMQLNPGSHGGSEWVHVKILEAKLKLAKDPNWLKKNRVLNTGVKFNSDTSAALSDTTWDIEYQLEERVPFTPFPDKILANVFDELGDLYTTQHSIELGYIAYDFSLQYDPADPYNVKAKMEQLRPLLKKEHIPIPSWSDNYFTRTGKKIAEAVAGIAERQLENPENIEKGMKAVTSLFDEVSGERERREKEKRQTFIIGVSVFTVLFAAFVLYMKKKKKTN
jgi:tetratricopeptide (TPR) repeat protein